MDILDELKEHEVYLIEMGDAHPEIINAAITEIESLRQQVKERTDFEVAIKDDAVRWREHEREVQQDLMNQLELTEQ